MIKIKETTINNWFMINKRDNRRKNKLWRWRTTPSPTNVLRVSPSIQRLFLCSKVSNFVWKTDPRRLWVNLGFKTLFCTWFGPQKRAHAQPCRVRRCSALFFFRWRCSATLPMLRHPIFLTDGAATPFSLCCSDQRLRSLACDGAATLCSRRCSTTSSHRRPNVPSF